MARFLVLLFVAITNFTSASDVAPLAPSHLRKVRESLMLYQPAAPPSDELTVDFDYVKKATLNNGIYIIDVREPEEVQELGKIPNSMNIPLSNVAAVLSGLSNEQFQQMYNRPKPRQDTEMIFYCMSGKRARMAQQMALSLGFTRAKVYPGSWRDWASKTL